MAFKIRVMTAIEIAIPAVRTNDCREEAKAYCVRGTELMTILVLGGEKIPVPNPVINKSTVII